ncbi:alpha/beta hydrolase [Actinoplanes bogorensis]|uniref:Alpha/beta hydrolase n=1 Tax=Paractinoplanes bogorensis TaxID=1610840 RepID=A0ABS5YX79_9ACTN|nr:alpha/beta hydrolase [Actinoplanes bogorensis]MBU2668042.1 alpha/beta hydrolase [Actinoplanes bogorensis]
MTQLSRPDADLYYELRGDGPLVVLAGAPMTADAFTALAEMLAVDHSVLTTDPRGINRSSVRDREEPSTPGQRADDLAALIEHAGRGRAKLALGSSGGAVSVLALAEAHPGVVETVVAHEPPLLEVLPDRDELWAATEEMLAIFETGDRRATFRRFMEIANLQLPDEVVEMMAGGEPTEQERADEAFQYRNMYRGTVGFRPDVERLTSGPARVLVGLGEDSAGELCDRTSRALAAMLGGEPVMFPGGHIGFAQDPAAFEPRLRKLL